MVRLYAGGRPLDRITLDNIRINRSLGQELSPSHLLGFFLEYGDKFPTNDLPLTFWGSNPLEFI